jgi:ATP-binding cassette, subfamily B, multidrug efflux pump
MFKFFESLVGNISTPPEASSSGPPPGLMAFYWHFVKQTKWLYVAMLVSGMVVALIDTLTPVLIGRLVGLMTSADPALALQQQTPWLLGIAAGLLIGRPLAILLDNLLRNNAVMPGTTMLIRWQSHWHVVRQSSPFFQDDFAGRIANRVMNTSNGIRESVSASIRAVWYMAAR